MARVVRFVRNYLEWDKSSPNTPWLDIDNIPADPLASLNTKKNSLSVYLLDDQETKLHRCIAAFAANRRYIQEIHIILFDETFINNMGFPYFQTLGYLPDPEINKIHKNISEISSQKLVRFASILFFNSQPGIFDKIQVKQLIMESIQKGWILKDRVNDEMKSNLGI